MLADGRLRLPLEPTVRCPFAVTAMRSWSWWRCRPGIGELRPAVFERHLLAGGLDLHADVIDQGRDLRELTACRSAFQVGVLVDLLLDAGELDQLRGELGRVHRIERVLNSELRHQEVQELVQVVLELGVRCDAWNRARRSPPCR